MRSFTPSATGKDSMTASESMTAQSAPVEVYPGAPLVAVAIELRFRRTLDALARMGSFQRAHTEFSKATSAEDDDPETVLLLDDPTDKGVAISPTMFSVITYSYREGFEGFRRWATPLLLEAQTVLDLQTFATVVYRYENLIDAVDATKLDRVLNVRLPTPETSMLGRSLYLGWEQEWPRGSVRVDISMSPSDSPHLHVDISSRCRGPIDRGAIASALDEAHRMGRLAFEGLITAEFRETKLRGRKS